MLVDFHSSNKRVSRMLGQCRLTIVAAIILATVSSCRSSEESYKYCNSVSGAEFVINFEDQKIYMGSRGSLDQVYPLISCGETNRSCFMSEVDFVSPRVLDLKVNPNFISSEKLKNGTKVTLGYKGKITKYLVPIDGDMPSYFILERDGNDERFNEC